MWLQEQRFLHQGRTGQTLISTYVRQTTWLHWHCCVNSRTSLSTFDRPTFMCFTIVPCNTSCNARRHGTLEKYTHMDDTFTVQTCTFIRIVFILFVFVLFFTTSTRRRKRLPLQPVKRPFPHSLSAVPLGSSCIKYNTCGVCFSIHLLA